MRREDFMKAIPIPNNTDVIAYDIELKDFINENVLALYYETFPIYKNKKEEYLKIKEEIELYGKTVDNLYLYKKNWGEQEYLLALQNDKKTFSILFKDVKKVQSQLSVLKNKSKAIDEKIELQKIKEKKDSEKKNETIDSEIEDAKNKLLMFRNSLSIYEQNLEKVDELIKENEEDFLLLKKTEESFRNGKL